MWAEITRYLYQFESTVLTGIDEAQDTPLRPGPASLLCHSHDENLWNLKRFLVRGVLVSNDGGWSFEPNQFIPGAGIGGLPGVIRFFTGSRRNAARYLKKRGLARPRIPWDELDAAKKEASVSSAISSQPKTKG